MAAHRWIDEPDYDAASRAQSLLSTDVQQGLENLKELAERGSVISKIYLAEAYEKGVAGDPDIATSVDWLRRATESGSSYAFYKLGRLYLRIKQFARAYEAFRTAAVDNFAPAQALLGEMYLKGAAVQRNVDRAIEFFEKAAAQNNVYAMGQLITLYIHGAPPRFHFGGILRPKRFLRGLSIFCRGMYLAIFSDSTFDDEPKDLGPRHRYISR